MNLTKTFTLKDLSIESDAPIQFAAIIKSRLERLYHLYFGDNASRYKPEALDYCKALFHWSSRSVPINELELEMDKFIAFLNSNMKGEKDKLTILGISDLQACAIYNKGFANKQTGSYDNAIVLYK